MQHYRISSSSMPWFASPRLASSLVAPSSIALQIHMSNCHLNHPHHCRSSPVSAHQQPFTTPTRNLTPILSLTLLSLHDTLHPLPSSPLQMRPGQMLHTHKFRPRKEIRGRIPNHSPSEDTLLSTSAGHAVAGVRLIDVAAAVVPDAGAAARFGGQFAHFGGAGDC